MPSHLDGCEVMPRPGAKIAVLKSSVGCRATCSAGTEGSEGSTCCSSAGFLLLPNTLFDNPFITAQRDCGMLLSRASRASCTKPNASVSFFGYGDTGFFLSGRNSVCNFAMNKSEEIVWMLKTSLMPPTLRQGHHISESVTLLTTEHLKALHLCQGFYVTDCKCGAVLIPPRRALLPL